jgi:hypothetical protein
MPANMHHQHTTTVMRLPTGPLTLGKKATKDHGKATSIHQSVHDGERAILALVHGQLGNNDSTRDTLNTRRRGREEQRREAGH